jgi:hypothetical protein
MVLLFLMVEGIDLMEETLSSSQSRVSFVGSYFE